MNKKPYVRANSELINIETEKTLFTSSTSDTAYCEDHCIVDFYDEECGDGCYDGWIENWIYC